IAATGLPLATGIQEFHVGNQRIDHYVVSASSPQLGGNLFTTTVSAQDALNVSIPNDSSTVVTMSSNTGHAQFDSDGNGTFGDNRKPLPGGSFAIHTKDSTAESLTVIATDGNGKTGSSSAITINDGPSGSTTTISANPTSINATGSSSTTITVQAKDSGNN